MVCERTAAGLFSCAMNFPKSVREAPTKEKIIIHNLSLIICGTNIKPKFLKLLLT